MPLETDHKSTFHSFLRTLPSTLFPHEMEMRVNPSQSVEQGEAKTTDPALTGCAVPVEKKQSVYLPDLILRQQTTGRSTVAIDAHGRPRPAPPSACVTSRGEALLLEQISRCRDIRKRVLRRQMFRLRDERGLRREILVSTSKQSREDYAKAVASNTRRMMEDPPGAKVIGTEVGAAQRTRKKPFLHRVRDASRPPAGAAAQEEALGTVGASCALHFGSPREVQLRLTYEREAEQARQSVLRGASEFARVILVSELLRESSRVVFRSSGGTNATKKLLQPHDLGNTFEGGLEDERSLDHGHEDDDNDDEISREDGLMTPSPSGRVHPSWGAENPNTGDGLSHKKTRNGNSHSVVRLIDMHRNPAYVRPSLSDILPQFYSKRDRKYRKDAADNDNDDEVDGEEGPTRVQGVPIKPSTSTIPSHIHLNERLERNQDGGGVYASRAVPTNLETCNTIMNEGNGLPADAPLWDRNSTTMESSINPISERSTVYGSSMRNLNKKKSTLAEQADVEETKIIPGECSVTSVPDLLRNTSYPRDMMAVTNMTPQPPQHLFAVRRWGALRVPYGRYKHYTNPGHLALKVGGTLVVLVALLCRTALHDRALAERRLKQALEEFYHDYFAITHGDLFLCLERVYKIQNRGLTNVALAGRAIPVPTLINLIKERFVLRTPTSHSTADWVKKGRRQPFPGNQQTERPRALNTERIGSKKLSGIRGSQPLTSLGRDGRWTSRHHGTPWSPGALAPSSDAHPICLSIYEIFHFAFSNHPRQEDLCEFLDRDWGWLKGLSRSQAMELRETYRSVCTPHLGGVTFERLVSGIRDVKGLGEESLLSLFRAVDKDNDSVLNLMEFREFMGVGCSEGT